MWTPPVMFIPCLDELETVGGQPKPVLRNIKMLVKVPRENGATGNYFAFHLGIIPLSPVPLFRVPHRAPV